MSWLRRPGSRCPHEPPTPFGPIRVPDSLLFPIDPVWSEEDQRWLRRYRFLDPVEGEILTEQVCRLIHQELVSVEPMKQPLGLCFHLPYQSILDHPDD